MPHCSGLRLGNSFHPEGFTAGSSRLAQNPRPHEHPQQRIAHCHNPREVPEPVSHPWGGCGPWEQEGRSLPCVSTSKLRMK